MNAVLSSSSSLSTRASVDPAAIAQSRAIKQAWLEFIRTEPVTAAHHAVYALLRGKSLDKTFSPLVHPGKINAQGGVANRARIDAEAQARVLNLGAWAPFASLLSGVPTKYGRYERVAHPLLDRVEAS